ncbi:MAG: xanthine dehydrogenase family protein subunit M [Anaerolineaceae bacterium]
MINSHPGLPEFDYIKPASLKEASQFLSEHAGEARLFMGGTDIIVRMRDGFYKEKYLVDVKGLDGADQITFDPKKGLTIGAAVTMNMVAEHPEIKKRYNVLAEAAHSVASYQLRNRATVVGNICNASPAGDSIGACLAMNGVLKVHGVDGLRDEPLSTFFKGPGKTVLKAGDVVTAVFLPLPPEKSAGKYIKLGRNVISDLSIVGVTVFGYADANAKSGFTFKLALASVAPVPFVPVAAEKILAEKALTEAVIEEAAVEAMKAVTPIDDVRGSAQYRKLMVRNLVRQGVTAVFAQLKK